RSVRASPTTTNRQVRRLRPPRPRGLGARAHGATTYRPSAQRRNQLSPTRVSSLCPFDLRREGVQLVYLATRLDHRACRSRLRRLRLQQTLERSSVPTTGSMFDFGHLPVRDHRCSRKRQQETCLRWLSLATRVLFDCHFGSVALFFGDEVVMVPFNDAGHPEILVPW